MSSNLSANLRVPQLLLVGCLLACFIPASGCGKAGPTNARVSGKVVVKGGIPLTEGKLILLPESPVSGQQPPGATLKPDGTFECYSSAGGAGIPPGKYKVMLSFPAGMGAAHPLSNAFKNYTRADTTPLALDVPAGGLQDVTLELEDAEAANEVESPETETTPASAPAAE